MAGSGQLPPSALGYVSGHRVRADLVPQTAAMVAAAVRDGIALWITQGYRSYQQQVDIFLARYMQARTGGGWYGDIRWWNGVRYVRRKGFAAAAVPGQSNHGWGQAIDFDTDSPGAIAWLTRRGREFGWSRPAWTFRAPTIEPWHWEAVPVFVNNPIGGGGGTIPTVPDLPDLEPLTPEEDMPLNQADLEAIQVLVAGQLDKRLRPAGEGDETRGVALSPAAEQHLAEWIDRIVAAQIDKRLRPAGEGDETRGAALSPSVLAALSGGVAGDAHPTAETADAVTDEIARRLMS